MNWKNLETLNSSEFGKYSLCDYELPW